MKPITVRQWFWILLLLSIPILNIILILYWAYSDKTTNQNLTNFSRAILLWILIAISIALLVSILNAS